jgi:hypothetical protein
MLDQIKLLLGISDDSKDGILNYLINAVTVLVKKYCHLSDVSSTNLQNIIIDFIVDRYRSKQYGKSDAPQIVSSISEGDTKVSFNTVQYSISNALTDDEKKILIPYRKLWL